jgi:hypothetical protein
MQVRFLLIQGLGNNPTPNFGSRGSGGTPVKCRGGIPSRCRKQQSSNSMEQQQSLTWNDILTLLEAMPPERLQDTATIYSCTLDEFFPVLASDVSTEEEPAGGILDPGAVFLLID